MNNRMRVTASSLLCVSALLCASTGRVVVAADATDDAKAPTPRSADGHPDLTGNWRGHTGVTFMTNFPSTREANGSVNAGLMTPADAPKMQAFLAKASKGGVAVPGGDNPPAYKDPAVLQKATQMYANGGKTDPVVGCVQPGLPRVGAPIKIVQTPKQIIFLYADLSGMVWRVIPTDGRSFRPRVDPSFYGDSVGHWEGDTLVVEARNFTDETWIGEYGYTHSDKMRVIETLKRTGNTLTYQATVDDPVMLNKPWVKSPVVMHVSDEEIEEPLQCVPTTYDAGHHEQRVP